MQVHCQYMGWSIVEKQYQSTPLNLLSNTPHISIKTSMGWQVAWMEGREAQ